MNDWRHANAATCSYMSKWLYAKARQTLDLLTLTVPVALAVVTSRTAAMRAGGTSAAMTATTMRTPSLAHCSSWCVGPQPATLYVQSLI